VYETVITVVGNVATEPSLRFTTNGVRVVGFRLASTERRYDKNLNGWRDGETTFYTVNCWRTLGENALESVVKGQPVLVRGRLRNRPYEKDGQSRTSLGIEAFSLGHDISRGVSRCTRASQSTERPELAPEDAADDGPARPIGVPPDEAARVAPAAEGAVGASSPRAA
jgi:single-strand DNA-binding protein